MSTRNLHNEEENLPKTSPLSKIKKEDWFKPPKGYFENLPHEINEKISKSKSNTGIIRFLNLKVISISIAAIAILAFFIFNPIENNVKVKKIAKQKQDSTNEYMASLDKLSAGELFEELALTNYSSFIDENYFDSDKDFIVVSLETQELEDNNVEFEDAMYSYFDNDETLYDLIEL